MTAALDTRKQLRERIRHIEQRLHESEEVVRALRAGEVDAFVASGPDGDQVYTLKGADAAYRAMVERMAEGALTLTLGEGLVLFSNEQFASIVRKPLERVVGSHIRDYIAPEDAATLAEILDGSRSRRAELKLKTGNGLIPVYLSAEVLALDGTTCLCVVVTDLSEQKRNEEIVSAEKLARSILEQAAEAVLVVAPNGQIIRASREAERLAGRAVMQRQFDAVFPIALSSGEPYLFPEILSAAMQGRVIKNLEASTVGADDGVIHLLLSAATLSGPDSELLGCVMSLTDVTQRKTAQERLALAENRFRRLLDASPVGIVETNSAGAVLSANDAFYRLIGWDRNSFTQEQLDLQKITPEDWMESTNEHRGVAAQNRSSTLYEKEYWRKDHSRVPVVVGLSVDEAASDDVIAVIVDLSEQKRAEQLLRESERQLRLLADAMPQIVWTARTDGQVDYFNQRWCEFTGSSLGAAADDVWRPVLHPDDFQYRSGVWHSSVTSGAPFDAQYRFWDRKSSAYRWYLGRALPLRDEAGQIVKWVGTCTDIDDHKRLNEELEQRVAARTSELKQSLTEKTTLLQEVHHRVKNNLQVISSLLSMQVGATDPKLSGALQEARHRVLAMSLIHEQLYQSETLSEVDFGSYVKLLARQLFDAYCVNPCRIQLQVNAEAITLPVDAAIPCGLILNELLSNSLKHAFPNGRTGGLQITFRMLEENRVELCVADSGVGLPPDFCIEDAKSMGFKVVRVLVAQLGAELEIRGDAGSSFSLTWAR